MLLHPRVAIASGLAAAAGAVFLIVGRIDGSVVLAAALVVGVRAGALASSSEPAAARALSRQVAVAPAWVGLAIVAALRSGSIELAGVRGAHAVAGIGALHGDPLIVAALWVAVAAAGIALIAPGGRGAVLVAGAPSNRLEMLGVGAQALLVVAAVSGPQVTTATDIVPWVIGIAVAAAVVTVGSRRAIERVGPITVVLAVLAVVLAVLGDAP